MDLSALRALALTLNFSAHGVDAVVTRPSVAAVTTRVIWVPQPREEQRPYGTDFQAVATRREMILPRDVLPTLPRGTVIVAPEPQGGASKNWVVDGHDPAATNYWHVIVKAS